MAYFPHDENNTSGDVVLANELFEVCSILYGTNKERFFRNKKVYMVVSSLDELVGLSYGFAAAAIMFKLDPTYFYSG